MPSVAGLKRRLRRLLRPRGPAPTILMYHRVIDIPIDPWDLAVPPADFDMQMAELRETRVPLAMNEFVLRARDGTLPRRAVAVTFDDGYLDNLVNAKPVLEKYGIPATIFVATGYVGKKTEYWWDELCKLFLASNGAVSGTVTINGEAFSWNVAADAPDERSEAFQRVWAALRMRPLAEIETAMDVIRAQLGPAPRTALERTMTADEVKEWLEGPLTSIGGHTITHPSLPMLSPDACEREVEESLKTCAELRGGTQEGFAYPYGDRDASVADIVKRSGAGWACSTREDVVRGKGAKLDLFDLPRIGVLPGNLSGQWIE